MKGMHSAEPGVSMWQDPSPFPFTLQGPVSSLPQLRNNAMGEPLSTRALPMHFYLASCLFVYVVVVLSEKSSPCASDQQPLEIASVQESLTRPMLLGAGKGPSKVEGEG